MARNQVDVELIGNDNLRDALGRFMGQTPRALSAVLYAEANNMMREAKEQIPFRTGVAKSSGRVMPPIVMGNTVTVELGFGGAASAYVEVLHENSRRASFRNGKKAQFLKDPVEALSHGIDDRLQAALDRIL